MPSSLEKCCHDFMKRLNKIELTSNTKKAEQRVSSFKITSIVYHQLSDEEDTPDEQIFDNPSYRYSKFCNQCNQFITTTHHRNTRSTQTVDKLLHTVYPKNGHDSLVEAISKSPRRSAKTSVRDTESQIQSSMSEFNFPTTNRNTAIQFSSSLSSLNKWPLYPHICTASSVTLTRAAPIYLTTVVSSSSSPVVPSGIVPTRLCNSMPLTLDPPLNDATNSIQSSKSVHEISKGLQITAPPGIVPTVTITYRCLNPRAISSSDSTFGNDLTKVHSVPQQVPTSNHSQTVSGPGPGTPTEILFARHNMTTKESSISNKSSPNPSSLFDKPFPNTFPFDYTPNKGSSRPTIKTTIVHTKPNTFSLPSVPQNNKRSCSYLRITPDDMRPPTTRIANSGSVLSVPRYYSEPIFSTGPQRVFTIAQPIVTDHTSTEPERKSYSSYVDNHRCNTVSSGTIGPITSPSIFETRLFNHNQQTSSLLNPFNNILLNVNPNTATSIRFSNTLQLNNNFEIIIQPLNTASSTSTSKLNVDKKLSPIKVVASGKTKYCTLCLRSFCGEPRDNNETVSCEQEITTVYPTISVCSDILSGSDNKDDSIIRRPDPIL